MIDERVKFCIDNIETIPIDNRDYFTRIFRIYSYYLSLLSKGKRIMEIEGKLYCDNEKATNSDIISDALSFIKNKNSNEYIELLDIIDKIYVSEYSNEDKIYEIKKSIMEYCLKHNIDCFLFTCVQEIFDKCYDSILLSKYTIDDKLVNLEEYKENKENKENKVRRR